MRCYFYCEVRSCCGRPSTCQHVGTGHRGEAVPAGRPRLVIGCHKTPRWPGWRGSKSTKHGSHTPYSGEAGAQGKPGPEVTGHTKRTGRKPRASCLSALFHDMEQSVRRHTHRPVIRGPFQVAGPRRIHGFCLAVAPKGQQGAHPTWTEARERTAGATRGQQAAAHRAGLGRSLGSDRDPAPGLRLD